MANSIKMKMTYVGTDETRNYTIDNVADTAIVPNTVRQRVQNFNGYLSNTSAAVFVSSDGNKSEAITEAKIITVEEMPIAGV